MHVDMRIANSKREMAAPTTTRLVDLQPPDCPRCAREGREGRTRLDPATRGEMSGVSPLYYCWLPWLVYAVLMEGGTHQATLGKMAIGIKVTTDGGAPNSYPRALVRNLLKVLSALTLFIGFAMAGWTQRKQALHDKIAECLVIVGKS